MDTKNKAERMYDAYHAELKRHVVGHYKQPYEEIGSAWRAAWEAAAMVRDEDDANN